ncbi:MAG: hypothetical protein WC652_05335 [archaeon]|jgi:hypothetical protein
MSDIEKQWFELYLDLVEENKLLFTYTFLDDYVGLEEFVIIYLTKVDDKFVEVVKYDFSEKEKLHVHYFYPKNPRKVFLDLEVNVGLLMQLEVELTQNWRKHLLKFKNE